MASSPQHTNPILDESTWRKAEQNMLRRERASRIRSGVIVPGHRGLPSIMAKDANGKWWPNANFVR